VQLQATDPNALRDWLAMHQYNVPAQDGPVIDKYTAEGFNFLAGPLSPIADSAARRDAGLAVLTHHLGLFKRQAEAASTQWWEHARRLGIATNVELFRTSAQMMPAHVLDSFLGVLKTASPGLHERYIEFHDRMNRP